MAQEVKLGQPAPAGAERDAIHVPVVPVVCGEALFAATPVKVTGFDERGLPRVKASGLGELDCVGILDPFFQGVALPGATMWMLVKPGVVVNLRHHWEHPGLEAPKPEPQPRYSLDDDDYSADCKGCYD